MNQPINQSITRSTEQFFKRINPSIKIATMFLLNNINKIHSSPNLFRFCKNNNIISIFPKYFATFQNNIVNVPRIKKFKNGIVFNDVTGENNAGSNKTLVIFCGWMSSTDKQLKTYLKYYHERNFNTLQFSVGPEHVFNAKAGTKHMTDILDITINTIKPNQILFHHFSIGGFLYGQMLRVLKENPSKYETEINDKICGQIFDSPPDMNSIPEGLAAHVFPQEHNPLRSVVKFFVELFMRMTASTNGIEWKASSNAFHNNYITHAPSLWYYSKADPVSRYEDCEQVIKTWESLGIDVTTCRWEHTPHIQHARKDPDRYFGELDKFLNKIKKS
jgi:hypothetical protein